MMMPANFSAVAENELTYVVGGASLVDYLAPAMTAQNWQNVSTNVVKIIGNTFLSNYVTTAFNSVFDGHYVPGDFIGGVFNTVHRAYLRKRRLGRWPGPAERWSERCWRSGCYLHSGLQPHRSGSQDC